MLSSIYFNIKILIKALYNVLNFKFDNKLNYSNIKVKNTKLILLNSSFLCCGFVRWSQHNNMRVWWPLRPATVGLKNEFLFRFKILVDHIRRHPPRTSSELQWQVLASCDLWMGVSKWNCLLKLTYRPVGITRHDV